MKRSTTHAYDFIDDTRLVCLICRNHYLVVGILSPLPDDLARIPRELLRGRALEMYSGAADSGPACRPSAGSLGGEG